MTFKEYWTEQNFPGLFLKNKGSDNTIPILIEAFREVAEKAWKAKEQDIFKFLDDEEKYAFDMQTDSKENTSGWRGYRRALRQIAEYIGHEIKATAG